MAITVGEAPIASLLYGVDLYQVPLYQRDFSWTVEEISQFWEDVARSSDDPEPYFFGSIILVGTQYQTLFEVLDGQQRLAAFSLLLAAARDSLPEDSPGRTQFAEGLMRLDIGGVFGQGQTHRLRLNRRDDPYFAPIARGNPVPPPTKPSHKLIRNAFQFLTERIQQRIEASTPDQFISHLMRSITERLRAIRILMSDTASAEMIFEAVNSAGLDLSQADLIKNHLLRSAPQNDAEALYQTWESVASRVEEGRGQLTDFVRTSVNSRYDFVRKNDLYKRVRDMVDEQVTAGGLLQHLSEDALFWNQLRIGVLTSLPAVYRGQVEKDLRDLWTFNIKLVEVPLLALRASADADSAGFARAIRWFRDFFVRYSVVVGLASNVIETQFSEWASRLRHGEMSLEELHASLVALAPNDEAFGNFFRAFSPRVQRVARTILARINDQGGGQNVITETLAAGGHVTLEHVVPHSDANWHAQIAEFQEAGLSYEEVLNNIGNLTLLPPTVNIGVGDDPFMEKRWAYEGREGPNDPNPPQPAPINAMLSQSDRFGPEEFEARRQWLADQAVGIWTLEP